MQQALGQNGPQPIDRALRAIRVGLGGVAKTLQFTDAIFQVWISRIRSARLDQVKESLEPDLRLGRALAQVGDAFIPAIDPVLAAVDDVVIRLVR